MATIIEIIKTQKRYILIGSGFGSYQSKKPHLFFGNLAAETDKGTVRVIYVSDENGKIHAISPKFARVVSIDGQSPADILSNTL
jgi:hypothetical protein